MDTPPTHQGGEVLIVGAGLAGIAMAIECRRKQVPFHMVDQAVGPGGCWKTNTYPGVACDVSTKLYRFRDFPFELQHGDEEKESAGVEDFDPRYPPGKAILRYIENTWADMNLNASCTFGVRVERAEFSAAHKHWEVEMHVLSTGERTVFRANHLVLALGQLSTPAWPRLAGAPAEATPSGDEGNSAVEVHTACWPAALPARVQAKLDAGTCRSVVVGAGASAVQVLPWLCKRSESLLAVQSSAVWVLPKHARTTTTASEAPRPTRWGWSWAWLAALTRAWERLATYVYHESLYVFVFAYVASPVASLFRRYATSWIASHGARTASSATPEIPLGCKRILVSDDYFASLAQPHVRIVHARWGASGCAWNVATGTVTLGDGSALRPDLVVYATGFHPMAALLELARHITAGGITLADAWGNRPVALYGVHAAGFPNLHLLLGPASGSAHTSCLFMAECQSTYVAATLEHMKRRGARAVVARHIAVERHAVRLDAMLARRAWGKGCSSWYERAGGAHALWPGSSLLFWWETRGVRARDYEWA